MYPKKEYTKNWGYVDGLIEEANNLGFSPALTHLMAAKWAGEGGRKARVGSLGLSSNEQRLEYKDSREELSKYRDTVSKILSSKGFKLEDFNSKSTDELLNALQYRPEGKVAGKDYYMFNDVNDKYVDLIKKTPEYRYFNQDYVSSKKKPEPVVDILSNTIGTGGKAPYNPYLLYL